MKEHQSNPQSITIKEFRLLIVKAFHCLVQHITFSADFLKDKQQYHDVYKQIQYLTSRYNLRNIKTDRVAFESKLEKENETEVYYGLTEGEDGAGQTLESINFGDQSLAAFKEVNFCTVRPSAKYVYIVTHEFAHVLTSQARNSYEEVSLRYWQDLEPLWEDYRKAPFLSAFSIYSRANIEEFHAEAFVEYHLSADPAPIAVEVGKLIDKYFVKH